jgi:hypothetical protein
MVTGCLLLDGSVEVSWRQLRETQEQYKQSEKTVGRLWLESHKVHQAAQAARSGFDAAVAECQLQHDSKRAQRRLRESAKQSCLLEEVMTRFESLVATGRVPMASRRRQMHRALRSGFGVLLGAALLVAGLAAGSTPALAQFTGPMPLTLINGWSNAPFSTSIATVEEVSGIVQFRGAIATSGTNAQPSCCPRR